MAAPLIPRILLGATIVLTAAAGYKAYETQGALKLSAQQLEAAVDTSKKKDIELASAAKQLQSTRAEKSALEADKAALETKQKELVADADKARADLATATAKATEQEAKVKELEGKLADAAGKEPAAPVVQQDPELLKKLADAEARAAEKEALLATLQGKAEEAEKRASALEADEARRRAGLNRPGLEGRVVAANSDWNFVVLNIGDRQGVVNGSSLLVKRGDQLLGKLTIKSVEPGTSIADVQPGSTPKGQAIQPGDVVIFPGS